MSASAGYLPGEAVEVLKVWAYGCDPAWFGGYEVVDDEGATVVVRDIRPGPLSGVETRWPLSSVRFRMLGPLLPFWLCSSYWKGEDDPEGSAERLYRGWRLDRY